jgi:predicted lipid-binding transport protein (Tim44 family)
MLSSLLSREVFDGFDAAIRDRESRNEKVDTTFVSIDKAEIVDAQVRDRQAQVTVRFVSQLITATRDGKGNVVDGNAEKVVEVTDVWTFARGGAGHNPNDPTWLLVATESAG